jgi:hypothetical protein
MQTTWQSLRIAQTAHFKHYLSKISDLAEGAALVVNPVDVA